MPVLYLAVCVDGSEDVSGFEVLVFGSPADVREWGFTLIRDGACDVFLFQVEDLDGSIVTSLITGGIPAAM